MAVADADAYGHSLVDRVMDAVQTFHPAWAVPVSSEQKWRSIDVLVPRK